MQLSKYAQMWEWTNIATEHRYKPKEKFKAIAQMALAFDDDTREHFRMALAQVLREERCRWLRKYVIQIMGVYFTWDEIEWTFWLHGEREPEDIYWLNMSSKYAKGIYGQTIMLSFVQDRLKAEVA